MNTKGTERRAQVRLTCLIFIDRTLSSTSGQDVLVASKNKPRWGNKDNNPNHDWEVNLTKMGQLKLSE
jgi:hypothetical protein